jgi:hypothetical protein
VNEQATELVMQLAKDFMGALFATAPGWRKAFWRLESDGDERGCSGSYVRGGEVTVLDPFAHAMLMDRMGETGVSLLDVLGKGRRAVCLLILDSEGEYKVRFDYDDLERWRITKIGGATGIPVGFE